jgi:hypothetical protein
MLLHVTLSRCSFVLLYILFSLFGYWFTWLLPWLLLSGDVRVCTLSSLALNLKVILLSFPEILVYHRCVHKKKNQMSSGLPTLLFLLCQPETRESFVVTHIHKTWLNGYSSGVDQESKLSLLASKILVLLFIMSTFENRVGDFSCLICTTRVLPLYCTL